jgi:hypothetical protein
MFKEIKILTSFHNLNRIFQLADGGIDKPVIEANLESNSTLENNQTISETNDVLLNLNQTHLDNSSRSGKENLSNMTDNTINNHDNQTVNGTILIENNQVEPNPILLIKNNQTNESNSTLENNQTISETNDVLLNLNQTHLDNSSRSEKENMSNMTDNTINIHDNQTVNGTILNENYQVEQNPKLDNSSRSAKEKGAQESSVLMTIGIIGFAVIVLVGIALLAVYVKRNRTTLCAYQRINIH